MKENALFLYKNEDVEPDRVTSLDARAIDVPNEQHEKKNREVGTYIYRGRPFSFSGAHLRTVSIPLALTYDVIFTSLKRQNKVLFKRHG
uniref:Uncharacterized protein n=1 Tax=Megaselia scalaris TaxID=36166 RepID=T1GCJ7_MEGSC